MRANACLVACVRANVRTCMRLLRACTRGYGVRAHARGRTSVTSAVVVTSAPAAAMRKLHGCCPRGLASHAPCWLALPSSRPQASPLPFPALAQRGQGPPPCRMLRRAARGLACCSPPTGSTMARVAACSTSTPSKPHTPALASTTAAACSASSTVPSDYTARHSAGAAQVSAVATAAEGARSSPVSHSGAGNAGCGRVTGTAAAALIFAVCASRRSTSNGNSVYFEKR